MRFSPTGRRRLTTWLAIAAAIYAGWCLLLYLRQDSMIFPRHLAGPPLPHAPRGVESLWFDGPERVEAWFWPAPGASADTPAPLAVFCHGNGELIDQCLEVAGGWRARGWSVLLPEYAGFGRSGGAPSERRIVADTLRFYDLAVSRPDVDPSRVVLHGRSLGGGVAAQAAVARPAIRALILESPFTSVASFAWGVGVPPVIVRHPFRNDVALRGFARPLLLLHGDRDDIVPPGHSRALHALVPGSSLVILAGDHNNFPDDPGAYWAAIDAFLAGAAGPAPGR